ncbi:choline ABC transporter substrate-binding protein [Dongia deserti]|uniref:choline ABC transporter substrate-binding protein n=1 Tax=Dongia deserti TaxID=2268030 RepID=UPI000E652E7C|nr:choline ABC transporter substrate-binding protein [Dongia deserti]
MIRFSKVSVAALLLVAASTAQAAEPQSCRQVRMAEPGWNDLAFTTGVASVLLEGLGYEPKSDVLGLEIIYASLKNKDLDVFLGYWDPAMQVYFDSYQKDGSVETIKQNLEGAKYTFAVPQYVHDAGIHDFADLAEHADKFDRKMYGIEPGSNTIMEQIIAENRFGLGDWELLESSEQGMLQQVKKAVRKQEWILFQGWAPHPMNSEIPMAYLSGGDEWYGPNYGGATVHTQVRKGYVAECPNVGKLLDNITFTLELENEGMAYLIGEAMLPRDAAKKAITAHPDLLAPWLAGVTTFDGKDGLAAVRDSLGLMN